MTCWNPGLVVSEFASQRTNILGLEPRNVEGGSGGSAFGDQKRSGNLADTIWSSPNIATTDN